MVFDMRSLRALFSDRLLDSIQFPFSISFVSTADPKAARWPSNVAALPGNMVGVDVGGRVCGITVAVDLMKNYR